MGKLEEIKALEKEYTELDVKANELVKPLNLERKKRWDMLSDWYEGEYAKIEDDINAMHDRQGEIEEKIEYIEGTMIHCSWCDKAVNELDKEAVENGFDYCTECYHDLDTCETCGNVGQYGVNTESNNIDICWECGTTHCDMCDVAHDCSEDEEDE